MKVGYPYMNPALEFSLGNICAFLSPWENYDLWLNMPYCFNLAPGHFHTNALKSMKYVPFNHREWQLYFNVTLLFNERLISKNGLSNFYEFLYMLLT